MVKRVLLFESPVYLSLRQRQLDIQYHEETERTRQSVPIEDVGVVVLDNPRITITTAALSALCEGNVAVIACDKTCMPVGLMLPLNGNTLQSKVFRAQAEMSLPLKKQLWKQTVFAKIKNQKRLLELEKCETSPMTKILAQLKSGDSENCEGQAAAFYWKNIFRNIPNFVRERDGVPPNNLLNYGYAILRALVARAVVSAGLHPTNGIFHRNQYNAYCLVDDLMEPYRPFVDKIVLDVISGGNDISELSRQLKGRLFGICTVDVLMSDMRRPLMAAVSQTASSFASATLSGNAKNIAFPEVPAYATL